MEHVHYLIFILLSVNTCRITIADDEEVCCEPRFLDVVKSCPNFDNTKIDLNSLILGFQNVDNKGGLCLSGSIKLLADIDDKFEVELSVSKLTDLGKEYVWGAGTSLCGSMKDKDVPWAPLLASMNISSCPIMLGTYSFENVVLDLDFAKNVMTEDFCDDYVVTLSFLQTLEEISCHIFDVEIYKKSMK